MRTGFARPKIAFAVAIAFLIAGQLAKAAQLKEAQVTQIVKEVNLLAGPAEARPATVNDPVRDGTAVRTGAESRAELTFTDQTLARLGANTVFSFNEGTRRLDLGGGAILLRVPKGAGGATVRTAAVTAAITGTTIMLEYHPGDGVEPSQPVAQDKRTSGFHMGAIFSDRKSKPATEKAPNAFIKLICLEGIVRMYIPGRLGESVLIRAGQMIIVTPDAKRLPDPVDVDLDRLTKTSLLYNWGHPMGCELLVAQEIQAQQDQKSEGELMDTNMVIVGGGTLVTLVDPSFLNELDQIRNLFGLPGLVAFNEIGPLNTITTPNPYVINNTTSFVTAPTITTNGITDGGKLYRGMALDGVPGDYMFGASSAFDSSSGFNEQLVQQFNLPIAVFKFNSLRITGNAVVNIPPGGATKLALISIGDLTSGPPGGTLTFTGLDTLMLFTQNGSINLTADVSFSNLPLLWLRARGSANANLTIASIVTGGGAIRLDAEGSVQVNADETVSSFSSQAGVDFLDGTGHVTTPNISITAGNNITFTSADFGVGPGVNPFVFLQAGNNLTIDLSGNQSVFTTGSGVFAQAGAITVNGLAILIFPSSSIVQFIATAGAFDAPSMDFLHPGDLLSINAATDITAMSIQGGDLIQAGGNITTSTGSLEANTISAGGNIQSAAEIIGNNSVFAGGTISNPTSTLMSPSVTAIGNITTNHVVVQNINPGFSASNSILSVGGGGITPFLGPSGSGLQHTFTVNRVVSPQGIDFSGAQFGPGSNGGLLTINALTQGFGAGGISGANFNGADAPDPVTAAGNGGSFTVNSAGALSLTNTSITATTGIINPNADASVVGGSGGNVTLNSGSTVNLTNSTLQVSSNDGLGTVNRRSSATGGNITISSAANAGTAIMVDNTSQLLALLENTTPGPGGLIKIEATSVTGNSQINIDNGAAGRITATKGGIDVRHFSDSGVINLTNAGMIADVIKIATLGDSSTLNIGGGFVSATTLLRLYAGSISASNNSTINFTASVNLSGAQIDIAAHNVNILGAATVVTTSSQANVYTVVANYQGSGGTGDVTTGTFGGAGAQTLPLLNAPLIGPPGGP